MPYRTDDAARRRSTPAGRAVRGLGAVAATLFIAVLIGWPLYGLLHG